MRLAPPFPPPPRRNFANRRALFVCGKNVAVRHAPRAGPTRTDAHRPTLASVCRCSRGNGQCNCADDDLRCPVIKQFFEGALDGPSQCDDRPSTVCETKLDLGFKSCTFRPDQSCWPTPCWQWAVSVMVACPEFYPDMSERQLCLCPPRPAFPRRSDDNAGSSRVLLLNRLVAAVGL